MGLAFAHSCMHTHAAFTHIPERSIQGQTATMGHLAEFQTHIASDWTAFLP